ncbi:hypothetical protein [Niastella yeongjuensis]|nr:hypothetical protein [Niastella yeongjuensis]
MRLPYYSYGIKMVQSATNETVLMASPEKAICDIIVVRTAVLLRSIRQTQLFLEEDLRIEREALRNLDRSAMMSWIADAHKKSSLVMLIKTLDTI